MYREDIACHGTQPSAFNYGDPTWGTRDYSKHRHCSYCGSIHPEDLLKLFEEGAYLQGSDWKYGYPHKFYVAGAKEHFKFYTKHLQDLMGEPEFETVARAIFDKQDGKYYPRVAFIQGEKGVGYVTNAENYDDALSFWKEEGN